jgi:diaminopropionate ammonia-lyase
MPEHTGSDREKRIVAYGASVVRVPGNFDASVDAVEEASNRSGWILFTETGQSANPNVTRDSISGYSVIGQEIVDELGSHPPSHVFVSAGSGALGAGIAAGLSTLHSRLVVVEPASADGLFQSAVVGSRAPASGDLRTVMDGLAVKWPSVHAWSILEQRAFAFMTVTDGAAISALRRLARPINSDRPLEIGETGVAATAGAITAASDISFRNALNIATGSRLLAIGCEGVTDRGIFQRLLDSAPESLASATYSLSSKQGKVT